MIAKDESPVQTEVPEKGGPLYPDYLRMFTHVHSGEAPLTQGHLAHYDPLEQVEPVGAFEHDDPGHRADPAMPNLLAAGVKAVELSPHCGTELLNVQIVSGEPFDFVVGGFGRN
jgi:sulfonate dioxygenase